MLDRAVFEQAAFLDRIQVLSTLSMDRTTLTGPASLEGAEIMGGFWCNATRFKGRCNAAGMEVHGRTWLRGTSVADGPASGDGLTGLIGQIHTYGYLWT